MENHISDQESSRLTHLENIEASNISAFPYKFVFTHKISTIKDECFNKTSEELISRDSVSIAGRLVSIRDMGKSIFVNIQENHERIQVYLRKTDDTKNGIKFDGLVKDWNLIKNLDTGDYVGVVGRLFRTKTNELSIYATSIVILSKSLKPLPFPKIEEIKDEHGNVIDKNIIQSSLFKNVEMRYRQRYADLSVNPDISKIFRNRTLIIQEIRTYLVEHDFLEVETPTLQTVYGGASARPFTTHHNALDMSLYLRISNELYLKRMVSGGFDRVFEFVKDFRNEGIDRTHNPEFTQVEFYQAYSDYNDMIIHFQTICQRVAKKVLINNINKATLSNEEYVNLVSSINAGDVPLFYQGRELTNFFFDWERLPVKVGLERIGICFDSLSTDEVKNILEFNACVLDGEFSRGRAMMALFEKLVEPTLFNPTFVMDHPKESTPLCKIHRHDPSLVERFEPSIAGMEVGNSYSELNDPRIQRNLLEEQVCRGRGGENETHMIDEDFIRAMEYGMPPMGGIGMGIDRLVMILTNQQSIRDVILFPLLRNEF